MDSKHRSTNDEKRKVAMLPDKSKSPEMFDRIAPRYDMLNRLLSGRRDIAWRRRVASFIKEMGEVRVLDIATGTGDVLLTIFDKCKNVIKGVGLDPSGKMLEIAQKKTEDQGLSDKIKYICGNALDLPFEDSSFDVVTIAFGIRNVTDVDKALKEMLRVLKSGGKVLILEFSLPSNSFMRWCYLTYFRYILPILGAIISGDKKAYKYLNETVETFPYGDELCSIMEKAGFVKVEAKPLTFGIATIYVGHSLVGRKS